MNTTTNETPERELPSTTELIKGAIAAHAKWAAAGFEIVDENTFIKRMNTCFSCEYYVDAPSTTVYKIATAGFDEKKICGICGCVVARKARYATGHCPHPHEEKPGFNKWEELL